MIPYHRLAQLAETLHRDFVGAIYKHRCFPAFSLAVLLVPPKKLSETVGGVSTCGPKWQQSCSSYPCHQQLEPFPAPSEAGQSNMTIKEESKSIKGFHLPAVPGELQRA